MIQETLLKWAKILSPALASLFILISVIVYYRGIRQGTVEFLVDKAYLTRFVADVGEAKLSITCAMYMFKFDGYLKNNLQEPTPLLAAAFIDAAKRGVNVSMIFDEGKADEITTKYNQDTAEHLIKNGVKVIFDSPGRRLHSKLCVIDNKILFIGSHNYTFSAMSRNSETSARIVSKDMANDASKYFKSIGLE